MTQKPERPERRGIMQDDPDIWLATGYAHLLCLLLPGPHASLGIRKWQADVAFNTSRILREGGNPWEVVLRRV